MLLMAGTRLGWSCTDMENAFPLGIRQEDDETRYKGFQWIGSTSNNDKESPTVKLKVSAGLQVRK